MLKSILLLSLFIASTSLFAQDGKVLKILGGSNSYLMRAGQKIALAIEMPIEQGDEIFSDDSVLMIHLFPSTQISLSKNSNIKIDENSIEDAGSKEKSTSVIQFFKGIVRLHVTKDANEELEQRVQGDNVAFAVRGTDYEISKSGDVYDLDVHEGEVEVSSPDVMTFVPEIVKANKGLSFNRAKKSFASRKFGPRFKDAPGFLKRDVIRGRWLKDKEARRAWKLERQQLREKRKNALRERKEIRRTQREDRKKRK